MTTTITYGEAIDTIDNAISDFANGLELADSTIADITFAVNNDLQMRDYLIGLPNNHGLNISAGFVNELSEKVAPAEKFAYDTVNAMYHYELKNIEACKTLLDSAELSNPDYNLPKLIKRVISAEWPASTFTSMRTELASTVVAIIADNYDFVIGEDN